MNTAPPPPSHAVDRANLRALLDGAMTAPLSLLVAPAGSGKTVLLSQWAQSHPDLRFFWLEVHAADDDPARFLRHLLRGLVAMSPDAEGLGPLLTIGARGLGLPLLESLVALLAEHPGNVLIFDDLHHLTNRAIIDDLWWLADNAPPGTHIVFSSRVDLRLAWSRHRLRHSLLEIRQADLAFDTHAVAALLERIAGGAASATTVASVMDSTEGWAAGVQLSAISLRHHSDPEAFAQRLAGTDRLISDYLSEEVLGAQSEERRELLLRLSALDALSPALVEDVLGIADGALLFDELQRESMFLVSLDDRREWFRFHHLFQDLLRYRLRAHHPDEESRILHDAADWYAARGEVAPAVECCLRAGAWDRAIEIILSTGRETFERGLTPTVARWLSAIPDQVRRENPASEVLYGIVLGMSGDAAHAEDVLRSLMERPDLDMGLRIVVQTYIAARVQFRPQVNVSIDAARDALRLLQRNPTAPLPDLLGLTRRPLLQALAMGSRGRGHLLAGEWSEARKWLQRTIDTPGGQYSAYRIHLVGSMALLEAWSGRLSIAEELAGEALSLACDLDLLVHPAPADAYLAVALVAIHRGRPDSGAAALHEGAVRAASNQRTQLMWIAHMEAVLADDPIALRSPETPVQPPPIVREALAAASRRNRRLVGHPTSAEGASRAWSPTLVEDVSAALASHNIAQAHALLDGADFVPSDDVPIATVEHGILAAWLAQLDGRPTDCRILLSAAVELASSHGLVSVFLWAGPEVIRLVENLPGAPTPFQKELLACAHERFRPSGLGDDLTDPLTDRERELLVYLPSRLTNAELATRLYVSVNTVKTHTAHIYRKLGVPNRSAAVSRATELGLL